MSEAELIQKIAALTKDLNEFIEEAVMDYNLSIMVNAYPHQRYVYQTAGISGSRDVYRIDVEISKVLLKS